jgi:hypothetical protein
LSKWLKDAGIVPSADLDNPVKEWDRGEEPQGPDLDEFDVHLHALEALFHRLPDENRAEAAQRIKELGYRVVGVANDSPTFLDI